MQWLMSSPSPKWKLQIKQIMNETNNIQERYLPGDRTRGGGYSGYIKGGLRCGHTPKRGVLGAGRAPKKGGLRCGHNQKRGVLDTSTTRKKGEFRTDFVKREGVRNWSCSKGGLGSLFIYYLYFYLSIWSTSGMCSGRLKKGGLRCGHS